MPSAQRSTSRVPAPIAVMALFLTSGVLFALWGVHIPVVKAKFGLTDAHVAWLLLCVSGGALAAMAPVGRWIDRNGSAAVCRVATVTLALVFAVLMWLPNLWWLAAVLVLFGASHSALDVAMNAQAVGVEERLARPVMSRLHGVFSVGGIVGSALGSAALAHGWAAEHTFVVGAVAALIAIALVRRALLEQPAHTAAADRHLAGHAARQRLLWALGLLALVGLVIEGAMYDWSSVYQHDVLALPASRIGTGYAAFSIGMSAARFAGDATRRWLGSERLVQASGALCVVGVLLLCVGPPEPLRALVGFATLGIGCANLVPVLFAEAAVLGGGSATAIAFVARLAYVGLLVGPVLIGALSARVGLQHALWLLAAGSLAVMLAARPTLRLVHRPAEARQTR